MRYSACWYYYIIPISREIVCADVQLSLEHVMADREALTVRLNESCPADLSIRNNKKVQLLHT